MHLVIQQANLFGALFCVYLGLVQLVSRNRKAANYLLAILMFASFDLLFYAYLNHSRNSFATGFLNHLYVPANYFLGASTYLFYFDSFDHGFSIQKKHLLYFIPGIVLFAWFFTGGFIAPELFAQQPRVYFEGGSPSWIDKVMFIGFFYNSIFYTIILFNAYIVFSFRSLTTEASARIFLSLFIVTGVLTFFAVSAYVVQYDLYLYIACALATALVVFTAVFGRRYPEFFNDFGQAIEKAKYRRSRLEGIDVEELQDRLFSLMYKEKLYLEENLSLSMVAEELEIKPHQLSEFMNRYQKMNFSRFVNQFRVDAAAKMLLDDPEANVLSVAFQVGFNSKATFYSAFQSQKGMSPSEFIKQQQDS